MKHFISSLLVVACTCLSSYSLKAQPQCCCSLPDGATTCVTNGLPATFDCEGWCAFVNLAGNAGELAGYASPDDCAANCSTLPVELTFFKGQFVQDRGVKLFWKTASEINNRGFELERVANAGENWATIAFIDGMGNTSADQFYTFMDKRPAAGSNYYRLRQIDFDGQFEYSNIVAVEALAAEQQLIFYPITATDEINLKIVRSNYAVLPPTILFFDLMGRKVGQYEDGRTTFDVSAWPHGTYIAVVKFDNQTIVQRFFKL
ncbi:MAG: T9SS type A sorting domain-containing protein [Bacteroidota bacterium]